MKFLSTVFLIFVCCGAMRPASAQTIQLVTIPCAGCTTQATLAAAAQKFLSTYMEKTPPGYVGLIEPPSAIPNGCSQGQEGATTVLVEGSSIAGTFYGCYVPFTKGTSKVENVAIATGDVVSLLPKYQVVSVYYAPPGAKSTATYGSSYMQSTNSAFSNTFSVANQVSIGVSSIAPKGNTGTVAFGWSQSSTTSDSLAVSTTTSESVIIPGPSSSKNGIDHTQDQIYVWLNPGITVNFYSGAAVKIQVAAVNYDNSDPDQGMDIYALTVAELKVLAAGGSPTGVDMTRLARSWSPTGALTPADYQGILAADPFVDNANYNPSTTNRFDTLAQTVNYEPAGAGGLPITTVYNSSYTTTSTAGRSATDAHSVEVSVAGAIPVAVADVEIDLKAQTTWTWTNMWSTMQTSAKGQTANFSIVSPLPTDGYTGPTAIGIYKDNVYGTFMFYGEL